MKTRQSLSSSLAPEVFQTVGHLSLLRSSLWLTYPLRHSTLSEILTLHSAC